MDLGISGKKALVCAASKGLGKGCAMALAREGVEVTIIARTRETLEATAEEIRAATGGVVKTVAGDITTAEGRAAALDVAGSVDILVNNAGGPPPGDWMDWTPEDWMSAVNNNMITAIELMKAVVPAMSGRKFGRIVNITSSAVKAPIDILGLSNGARSGLTGFVAGTSRKTVRDNVTINNILPGPFDTDRLGQNFRVRAEASGQSVDELRAAAAAANPAGRFGNPDEFGAACAFLCSVHAGYITGQNLLLDGGAYPGTF